LNASDVTMARRTCVTGWGLACALLLGVLTSGCQNQCQELCGSWYAYNKTICGERFDATDLNRCLADYRSLASGSAEDQLCGYYLEFVQQQQDAGREFCGDLVDDDWVFGFELPNSSEEEDP
jgi:hypothetical protein